MKLAIIIIGDEILLGRVTDTNSGAIARAFDPLGFQCVSITTVGDNREDITAAIATAMSRADLVVITGGLGPTKDDITKRVLTDMFGGQMYRNNEVTEHIKAIFAGRGLKLNRLTMDQALVPSSCRVIQNRLGTAPIMWFEREAKVLVSMPGVPMETEGMLPTVVEDVARHFLRDMAIDHRTFMVSGISESALAEKLATWEDALPDGLHLAYLPDSPIIRLRLDGANSDSRRLDGLMNEQSRLLEEQLGSLMIYRGQASPAEIVLERLRAHHYTLATAESCTGGNIAAAVTAVAGCSDVYLGSLVSYANEVKTGVLGVERDTLAANGAVSREVVEMMSQGVCRLTGADCSVATSGIAGPGGGTDEKPVGTVWIAVTTPRVTTSRLYRMPGDRSRVIARAVTTALLDLLDALD